MLPLSYDVNYVYVIVSPTSPTKGPLPMRGYASRAGRVDVVARALTEIRRGSAILAVLEGPPEPPKTLVYVWQPECVIASERQAIVEISRALLSKSSCIRLVSTGLDTLLYEISRSYENLILLDEKGDRLDIYPTRAAFFMGSHIDIPPQHYERISKIARRASIGPLSYHTEHVVAYLEWARTSCNGAG